MTQAQSKGKDFIDKSLDFFAKFSLNQWLLVVVVFLIVMIWAVGDLFTLGLSLVLSLITAWLGYSLAMKRRQDKKDEWIKIK